MQQHFLPHNFFRSLLAVDRYILLMHQLLFHLAVQFAFVHFLIFWLHHLGCRLRLLVSKKGHFLERLLFLDLKVFFVPALLLYQQ